MVTRSLKTIAVASLLVTSMGCEKLTKRDDKSDVPETEKIQTIQAQNSDTDIMTLKATVRRDGVMLNITEIPKDAKLECHLNNKPLSPCHDGALFAIPVAGEYTISAAAMVRNKAKAMGRSNSFIIVPTDSVGGNQNDSQNPLNLVLDDPNFKQNMAWKSDRDFKVSWKFFKKPTCNVKLKCRYPSKQSPFWVDCDKSGTSFTFPRESMATGLQFLTVQATCENTRGPELNLQWYGVPVNYQPLMIQDISDSNDRHIFNLVKSNDCSSYDDLKFVCSRTTGADFSACENGNVVDNPPPGFRIRASCKGQMGPALAF